MKGNNQKVSQEIDLSKELSKRKRNSVIHHLGIPYYIGKKVSKIILILGKKTGTEMSSKDSKTYKAGLTLGDIVKEESDKKYKAGYTLGDTLVKNVKEIHINIIKKEK